MDQNNDDDNENNELSSSFKLVEFEDGRTTTIVNKSMKRAAMVGVDETARHALLERYKHIFI